MKFTHNLTTSREDLERYESRAHFLSTLKGFDGVELMYYEADSRGIVPPEKVLGMHLSFPTCWLDFWNGDLERVRQEFGSLETAYASYGGTDGSALVRTLRRELAQTEAYQPEYLVFHATDSGSLECLRGEYAHTDEEVVDALCELLNQALPAEGDGPWLLLENLWEPGLRFTRPEITARLLEGIRYPKVGLMLDTGHLMHTNLSLRSQKQALEYLNRCLDAHGELCSRIRGVHLQQSITGAVMRRMHRQAPERFDSYEQQWTQLFTFIFQMDLHRPFVCPGVWELLQRIAPDYVTYEFISGSLEELQHLLRRQENALRRQGKPAPERP